MPCSVLHLHERRRESPHFAPGPLAPERDQGALDLRPHPLTCPFGVRISPLQERASRGTEWTPAGRVFTTRTGEPLDAANVRRDFKAIVKKAGLEPEWTPRELRHSFVSLLSDHGIPLERIALLVGHSSQATTEAVYRKQLRPVITEGAEAMDDIFAEDQERGGAGDSEEGGAVA
ncbi:tyrosine-type recombinase/integrase [Streptomyces phaeofaciens]|uniref:tyrosine-type recombinase/integrase n=1 Tax=Streptomyces phaeofaciens TaxID=68254 RepID=UPI00367F686B